MDSKKVRLGLCLCQDPECPSHKSRRLCRKPALVRVMRPDMSGTVPACPPCAEDAIADGCHPTFEVDGVVYIDETC